MEECSEFSEDDYHIASTYYLIHLLLFFIYKNARDKETVMENGSLNKLRKLLIANTICLLLIVLALLMSPLVSSARTSSSGYNPGTTATFVDIRKHMRGNLLN